MLQELESETKQRLEPGIVWREQSQQWKSLEASLSFHSLVLGQPLDYSVCLIPASVKMRGLNQEK